ncbi:hypothetical protein Tco_1212586 [Tanacetum coccineum]
MSTLPPGRRHCRPAKSSMGLPPDASLCRPVGPRCQLHFCNYEQVNEPLCLETDHILVLSTEGTYINSLRECEDEFEGRSTTLGVTLITTIGGPMGTLSLVSEYLKDLEECMDDGDSKVAKDAKLFDALEHKSVVIEVDNQQIAIFTKAPLQAFGEPFMSNYGINMVNDVDVEIHRVKFKANFVVLDYVNEGEPSKIENITNYAESSL